MFGYIHANNEELIEENKVTYKAYYCGLCQTLRSNYGRAAQMMLNYDCTFLVILLAGLYEPKNECDAINCIRHPAEKQNVWTNEYTSYAAAMNVILGYYNLLDDIKDGNAPLKKKVVNALSKSIGDIEEKYPRQCAAVKNYIEKLDELEANDEKNIDLVSGLTGEMLAEVFVYKEDEWADNLRTLGFYMGKFIYLMDAYEDLDGDVKKGNYNCLAQYRNEKDYEVYAKQLLTSMMAECAKVFERLPIVMHADILRNIIYSGVWSRYELHIKKLEKKNKKSKK